MSARLPIGDVANEAVQFGIAHWITVLRFAWLPYLIGGMIVAASLFLTFDLTAFSSTAVNSMTIDEFMEAARYPLPILAIVFLIVGLVFTFLTAGIFSNIADFVVIGDKRGGFVHLRTDGPTQRVFHSYVISGLISLLIVSLAAVVALLITGKDLQPIIVAFKELAAYSAQATPGQQPPQDIIDASLEVGGFFGLLVLLSSIPLFYTSIKLTPFSAGSAIENRLILFKSFSMTTGHFWSIVLSIILILLFLIVVQMIYSLADIVLNGAATYFSSQQGTALLAVVFTVISAIAAVVVQVFSMTVQAALQCIIYRRLETGE
ncbi:MAG: hypothetical protein AAF720_08725 [Pseudomonadota bacterium]